MRVQIFCHMKYLRYSHICTLVIACSRQTQSQSHWDTLEYFTFDVESLSNERVRDTIAFFFFQYLFLCDDLEFLCILCVFWIIPISQLEIEIGKEMCDDHQSHKNYEEFSSLFSHYFSVLNREKFLWKFFN